MSTQTKAIDLLCKRFLCLSHSARAVYLAVHPSEEELAALAESELGLEAGGCCGIDAPALANRLNLGLRRTVRALGELAIHGLIHIGRPMDDMGRLGIEVLLNALDSAPTAPFIQANASRIEELRTMPYAEYLHSPEWKGRREHHLKVADHRCQLCYSAGSLQVHHRTYERRGSERFTDLIVLCDECHTAFHDRRSLAPAIQEGGTR
jgi:hypothetical protein